MGDESTDGSDTELQRGRRVISQARKIDQASYHMETHCLAGEGLIEMSISDCNHVVSEISTTPPRGDRAWCWSSLHTSNDFSW